jgi:hypothetical protein
LVSSLRAKSKNESVTPHTTFALIVKIYTLKTHILPQTDENHVRMDALFQTVLFHFTLSGKERINHSYQFSLPTSSCLIGTI